MYGGDLLEYHAYVPILSVMLATENSEWALLNTTVQSQIKILVENGATFKLPMVSNIHH
jgi:hypothetical protein